MNSPLLQVKGLRVDLGEGSTRVRAVDGVDFSISAGECFALLGESGCGKSMTALSLLRLLPPVGRISEGEILLGSQDLLQLPEARMRDLRGNRLAMIFQEPMSSLNPVLTVGQQIGESLRRHKGLRGATLRAGILALLDSVGIPDVKRRIHEYPHQLSGGMKQRVMIAIALAGEPELLIADEPTTALDVTIQAQVLALLRQLQQETGMAILLITHDLGVVAGSADQVGVMYAGQLVENTSCEAFFAKPQHPYSRKLFDSLPTLAKRRQTLQVIRGSVPPLNQIFPGCRFVDRCEQAQAHCHTSPPIWETSSAGHQVRCHLYTAQKDPIWTQSLAQAKEIVPKVATNQTLLTVQNLKLHFPVRSGLLRRINGQVKAVDGISLELLEGRTLALVGESGCGKTTLGKGILQLLRPTEGHVWFEGTELTKLQGRALRRKRADLQIIFQDPYSSMNPRMLVGDIIEEGMKAQQCGGDAQERHRHVRTLLDQVGLPAEAAKRYPHEFSGGQRQRICIARALAVHPRMIVCDEPTSALDVSVQAQILNLLRGLQQELSLTYLFITHNISVVAYLAHEVAVMYLGRIVEQGEVHEVLERPQHPYTRALLAAVPEIEGTNINQIAPLKGDLPSPTNPPTGCHFHKRCPEAIPKCSQQYPEVTGTKHQVRCFLYKGV